MKKESGFTLIESLVAVFVFTVLMGAVSGLVLASYQAHRFLWEQAQAISEARRGIRVMVREIREARMGEDGSYPIVKAGDKEFVFFSDIDGDHSTEKVRYFLGTSGSGREEGTCVSTDSGGRCELDFSDFLSGDLDSAQVTVSVEGDLGWSIEQVDVYADDIHLGALCESGCSDCAGNWEGTKTFDVTDFAGDDSILFEAEATGWVDDFCDWEVTNHSFRARFQLKWEEDLPSGKGEFRKGVVEPSGTPAHYNSPEQVSILSYYVRNTPPIFEYFDSNGDKIKDYPARLKDTKTMQVFLQVDVNPGKEPEPFNLKSRAYLRGLERLYE